jgi:hypothetical protein
MSYMSGKDVLPEGSVQEVDFESGDEAEHGNTSKIGLLPERSQRYECLVLDCISSWRNLETQLQLLGRYVVML